MLSTGIIVLISVGATAATGILALTTYVLCHRRGGGGCDRCSRRDVPTQLPV